METLIKLAKNALNYNTISRIWKIIELFTKIKQFSCKFNQRWVPLERNNKKQKTQNWENQN